MHSGPTTISGVDGPIEIDTNFWSGRPVVTIGPYVAPSIGRRRFALPATGGGTVEASVRSTLFSPFPTIEIAGVKHPTGPALPVLLRVLIGLPLALFVGGALGGVVGVSAMLVNGAIARRESATGTKALLMAAVCLGAFFVWLSVAAAILRATD